MSGDGLSDGPYLPEDLDARSLGKARALGPRQSARQFRDGWIEILPPEQQHGEIRVVRDEA
jgi:hypothetical protein